jgi:hypothetical protein
VGLSFLFSYTSTYFLHIHLLHPFLISSALPLAPIPRQDLSYAPVRSGLPQLGLTLHTPAHGNPWTSRLYRGHADIPTVNAHLHGLPSAEGTPLFLLFLSTLVPLLHPLWLYLTQSKMSPPFPVLLVIFPFVIQ